MRFINADDYELISTFASTIGQLNLYAYCNDNPIMNTDESGTFVLTSFLIGLGIFAAIGAGVGAVSYLASEAISYSITGKWTWSWGMFLGSIIGGAIVGAISFSMPLLSITDTAFLSGFVSQAIGMGFENLFGESNYTLEEILLDSLVVGGISFLTAGLTRKIKIHSLTDRGSISQITRQISTKFFNGTISNISSRTLCNIAIYEMTYSAFSSYSNGLIDAIRYYVVF